MAQTGTRPAGKTLKVDALARQATSARSGSTDFGCFPAAQNTQIRNGAHVDQFRALGRPDRRIVRRVFLIG
jgi:hypothetical protein